MKRVVRVFVPRKLRHRRSANEYEGGEEVCFLNEKW
uniref:Uncharacterized protein n=1 Tax=Anopheles christyi TaxID=43041 RepID=A0A182KJ01_9DIPT